MRPFDCPRSGLGGPMIVAHACWRSILRADAARARRASRSMAVQSMRGCRGSNRIFRRSSGALPETEPPVVQKARLQVAPADREDAHPASGSSSGTGYCSRRAAGHES